jgi:protein-L-isoaspartate(D-aspartate) O-methyltransferase
MSLGDGVFSRERDKMVEEQLVRRGITDERVLAAMRRIPRHRFVDEGLQHRAYGDHPLPIGEEQTISQPYIVGLMTSLLELTGRESSIERLPRLAERARKLLEALGYANVWVRVGNGALGWPDEAPFDRILVAAAGPSVPPPLVDQLAEGGRLVAPVGDAESQTLTLMERRAGEIRTHAVGDCRFVPLVGKYAWEHD